MPGLLQPNPPGRLGHESFDSEEERGPAVKESDYSDGKARNTGDLSPREGNAVTIFVCLRQSLGQCFSEGIDAQAPKCRVFSPKRPPGRRGEP